MPVAISYHSNRKRSTERRAKVWAPAQHHDTRQLVFATVERSTREAFARSMVHRPFGRWVWYPFPARPRGRCSPTSALGLGVTSTCAPAPRLRWRGRPRIATCAFHLRPSPAPSAERAQLSLVALGGGR